MQRDRDDGSTIEAKELIQFALDRDRDHETRALVYGAVEEHEDDTELGAPVGAVVQTALESGDESTHPWKVGLALYDLMTRGEIYSPRRTALRTIELADEGGEEDVE